MNYTPTQPDKYNGKQILITSDRLIFNAKDDSILLFSNKAIGLVLMEVFILTLEKKKIVNL